MRTEARIAPKKRGPRRERGAAGRARPRTSVIIPAYNEEQGLPIVLGKLLSLIDETYEVIVVDDGSTDGTRDVAAAFPCRVVSHASNRGKAQAIKTGMKAARGEYLIFTDADDTYPIELIPRVASSLNKADMVVGSRRRGKEQIPAFNRAGNAIFRGAIRHLYGFKAHDPLTGLYGIRKTHLDRMCLDSDGFCIEAEIAIKAARMGLRVLDIPIEYRPRVGEAKLRGLQDGYQIFQTILRMLALYNPAVALVLPGVFLFAIGVGLMVALMAVPASAGEAGLGIHTFVLAAMLSLAGFNMAVFGFGLSLYALAHRLTREDLAAQVFLRANMARNMALLGIILLAVGIVLGAFLAGGWFAHGLGTFSETKALVLGAFLAVLGFQVASSAVFLSIFAGELRTRSGPDAGGLQREVSG
jgi:glycosyltransferase involved in cell wall biosynthesis